MGDDSAIKKKIMMVLAGIIVGGLILTFVILICDYMSRINKDTLVVAPNTFFCPLGEKIDSPIVIDFDNATEVFHQDYDLGNIIFSSFLSLNTTLDLANTMYGILQDTQREGTVSKLNQISVPENACYIGSEEITPTFNDQNLLSGLKLDLLHTNIQIYAWNTEYQLNSGKEGSTIELVMVLNENLVYGKIQKLGDTKMLMDILYGVKR